MKPDNNRPITIEDLLRLKRAERPPGEFWTEFDRALRAKQLSALVAKRPWWQTLPRVPPLLSRYRLVLGASAVLAITFLSVREYQSKGGSSALGGEPGRDAAAVSPAPVASASALPSREGDLPVEASAVAVSADQRDLVIPAATAFTSESTVPGQLSRMVSMGGVSGVDRDAEPQSPSARAIAANLAVVQFAEPVATRNLLGATHGFEARVMPTRVAVEPLQQMTPPSDTRRSRLLHAMVSPASLETSARTTERAASRIADDRLYDQVSRFGARGDRLQMKF